MDTAPTAAWIIDSVWQVFWLVSALPAFPKMSVTTISGFFLLGQRRAKLTAAGLSMNFTLFPFDT